jgi:NADPH:quinone reductase-like Zn-dependent oxidoreductase
LLSLPYTVVVLQPLNLNFTLCRSQVSNLVPGDHVVPLASALGTWRSAGVFKAADWHKIPQDLPIAAAATLTIK